MLGSLWRSGDPAMGRRWCAWIAALLLGGASGVVLAKSASAPFAITVTLFPPFKDTVDCSTTQHGSSFSVNCSAPGATATNPRFMLELYRDGAQVGTVEGSTIPGTVTSWKVLRIADRDFLEIVVGW